MAIKTRPSGIVVATFGFFDPFRYVNVHGFHIQTDHEAKYAGPIADKLEIEFRPLLQEGEDQIRVELACDRVKEMGIPGGLRAWWRVYKEYNFLSDNVRKELSSDRWMFFPGTVLCNRWTWSLCIPCLFCSHDCCRCDFYYLNFDCPAGRVALLKGLAAQAGK